MAENGLEQTARALVAPGKGILAADESDGTIKKRFDTIHVESTEENRRAYRELLFTTPGMEEHISGVILYDETIRQSSTEGTPFPELLASKGVIPGIKVDKGAKPLAASPEEKVTEGLDGLRERLNEYRELGAKFTKWRAVIEIGDGIPSHTCIHVNAHALARYAALSEEAGLVPIVEPEVLMDGNHSLERCYSVTEWTLKTTFQELYYQRVGLEGMLLKPNMVLSGKDAAEQAGVEEVAEATIRCLKNSVPAEFRSGGRARDRVPLRRPERRDRDRAPERDERAGTAPLGALLLLRAGAAGTGAQGLGRRGVQPVCGPGRLRSPREDEWTRPLRLLLPRDGERASGGLLAVLPPRQTGELLEVVVRLHAPHRAGA